MEAELAGSPGAAVLLTDDEVLSLPRTGALSDDAVLSGSVFRWITLGVQGHRYDIAVASAAEAEWLEELVARSASLLELTDNWDSYGASAPRLDLLAVGVQVVTRCRRAGLPVPQVVPTTRGGVQYEWHLPGRSMEIEVLAMDRFGVLLEDSRDASEIAPN